MPYSWEWLVFCGPFPGSLEEDDAMKQYTLIASRDPFESRQAGRYLELAADLKAEGNEVTVFLVQNGVMAARRSGASVALTDLSEKGVEILADSFSLRERSIRSRALADGVTPSELDVVVDHLAAGRNVIWH
jgi:predicted peroxiredoxin